MSQIIDQWIDAAIGETRYALAKDGRAFALVVTRWSDAGRRARWGEVYVGRVRAVERSLRGAFVDLGLKDEQGFLPLNAAGAARLGRDGARDVREGQTLIFHIEREGARAKGPNLSLVDEAPAHEKLGRLHPYDEDVKRDGAGPADAVTRGALDAAIEEASARAASVPGGGRVIIEPTAALTAIDVDAAQRKGAGDPEAFALALNMAAGREALRQLRLRNLGGLAAIDFVSLRKAESRAALERAMKDAARADPWGPILAPLSRFGILELSRAQFQRPLHERLCDEDGQKSAETIALEALRAIERETQAMGGRKIIARVARDVASWLDEGVIGWRAALDARIGTLWEIEAGDGPREKIDVRAV